MRKLLYILVLLTSISAYSQTNYYVKNGGSDSNTGLSDAQAWETLSKVNGYSFSAGDTVYFNRGDTWYGQQLSPLVSGTEEDPIVFAAYGTGAKPIITQADTLSGWTGVGNWRLQSANIYAIEFIPPVSRFLVDGAEVRRAESIADIDATNIYYIKGSVDSVYIYSTGNPSLTYSTMFATYPNTATSSALYINDKDWITVYNIDFQGGYYSAHVTSSEDILLESCNIGAYSPMFGILITGTEINKGRNINIRNCNIDAVLSFWETYSADYSEDGVRINGSTENIIVEYNTIKNWWHSNFYLLNLDGERYNDSIIVRYNNITSPDIPDSRGLNIDTYGQNATNVIIYGNYIHALAVMNQINCYGVKFYYNIIDSIFGCPYESGVGMGLSISGYNTVTSPENGKFYNNVFANCVDYGISITQYTGRPDKTGNEFVNNIFYNTGDEGLRIYNDPLIPTAIYNNIYRNNLFYNLGTEDVIAYWEEAMTVAEFNAENGNEGDVISDNLFGNPLFSIGFNLQPTSPAINAGVDVGLTTDYAGNPIVGLPDIGAYEWYEGITVSGILIDADGNFMIDADGNIMTTE
jgi:hypothetical protein